MASDTAQHSDNPIASILSYQASILSHANFAEAATAFATELSAQQAIERVSVGVIESAQCVVQAISHSTDTEAKYEINRQLAAAMEEAIQQAAVIMVPEASPKQPRISQANLALHKSTTHHICTIPLVHQSDIFGAVTLERLHHMPFDEETLHYLEHLIGLIAPVLYLKWQAQTPWYQRFKQECKTWLLAYFSNKQGWLKPVISLTVLSLCALLFVPVQFNISAPARLEGAIQRALVAPENGFLEQTYVRPGDTVKAQQVLLALADQELLLEKRRLESELAQHENAYSASLAQSNRVDLVINQSKAEEARAQLALIEEKLQHTKILAPFDGVIIKGDLKDSVGAPVQRGDTLLTIAPSDAFRLIIEVDERDIAYIHAQQHGQLALIAMPNQQVQFEVVRTMPVAVVKNGRNVFEVEGKITQQSKLSIKPGLEGIAKIQAGQQSTIWIISHRLIDWFKLSLWRWGL